MGDAKGVLSQGDFEAINAGLGKAIASVPTSKVMDVYNSMAGLIGSSPVPNYLYAQVNPQDAQAAYNALLEFKVVGLRAAASWAGGLIRSTLPVLGHLHELGLLGNKGAVSSSGSTVHVVRAAEPVGLRAPC